VVGHVQDSKIHAIIASLVEDELPGLAWPVVIGALTTEHAPYRVVGVIPSMVGPESVAGLLVLYRVEQFGRVAQWNAVHVEPDELGELGVDESLRLDLCASQRMVRGKRNPR
jgi:hypothetical protein